MHLGTRKDRPEYYGVLVTGVKDVLWQRMYSDTFGSSGHGTCMHVCNREISTNQGLD